MRGVETQRRSPSRQVLGTYLAQPRYDAVHEYLASRWTKQRDDDSEQGRPGCHVGIS